MTEHANGSALAHERTGRRGRRATRGPGTVASPTPRRPLRYGLAPTALVSDDQVEAMHQAALRVVRDVGIEMLDGEARALLAAAGARVDDLRVCLDPEMVTELVALAPAEFTFHGRSPSSDIRIGGNHLVASTVGSAPMYVTLDGRRRAGDVAGYRDFLRLAHLLPSIDMIGGYPVEPIDLHPAVRHLEAAYDAHTLTDLPFNVYSLDRRMNHDAIEMVRIARGVDDDTLDREPSLWTVVNANSPLRYDGPMLGGIIEMARRNQVVCITPFTLAGAMAPITLAGALVQQHAEALAGIALGQLVRPGSPVVYGGFTSNVDMRSGSPAFGTPEYAKAALVGGQLARHCGLPYRSSNVNASNAVDAQAGYESMWALWGAVMGGANVVMHGAGWMEGGLHASYEKMVIDADLLLMVAVLLEPLDTSDAELDEAIEAITTVGPGGHFFGTSHTYRRYATAFHQPLVSDWRNWESWVEAGSPDARHRAHQLVLELLASYEPPPMEDAVREELRDFVDRRVAEGGVPRT